MTKVPNAVLLALVSLVACGEDPADVGEPGAGGGGGQAMAGSGGHSVGGAAGRAGGAGAGGASAGGASGGSGKGGTGGVAGSGGHISGSLPEGNMGIASRYPGDKNITSDSAVVFADDFESASGNQLEAGPRWDNVWGGPTITQVGENVHGGSQAVQVAHDEPERSIGAEKRFTQGGYDTLFVRYYLKFHPQFPGCHHTGFSIFAGAPGWSQGTATGVRPDGTNQFQALLDHLAPFFDWSPPNNHPPGFSYVYLYHMDQSDVWGDVFIPSGDYFQGLRDKLGDTFVPRPNVIPELGRWHSFELMVQSNTPGKRDGRAAFWIDGVLTAEFPNLRFRTVDSLKPNGIYLTDYTSELFANQTTWYDDVVVATSYIGPKVK